MISLLHPGAFASIALVVYNKGLFLDSLNTRATQVVAFRLDAAQMGRVR
jgi:hypothetical protein